jgi:hypothetical protein
MADWTPSTELQQSIAMIAGVAATAVVRERDRQIKDGIERLSSRGGQSVRLRLDASHGAVEAFGEHLIRGAMDLMQSVYGGIPAESLAWFKDQIESRITSFAASNEAWVVRKCQGPGMPDISRMAQERIGRAAVSAKNSLAIKLAPVQVRVAEGIGMADHRTQRGTTVYNVTGANSRVNINSTDSSTNVVNIDARQLFQEMRRAVDGAGLERENAETLRGRIDEMEAAMADRNTFGQKYVAFVQVAANHMELFAPFLPALGQVLTGLFGG